MIIVEILIAIGVACIATALLETLIDEGDDKESGEFKQPTLSATSTPDSSIWRRRVKSGRSPSRDARLQASIYDSEVTRRRRRKRNRLNRPRSH